MNHHELYTLSRFHIDAHDDSLCLGWLPWKVHMPLEQSEEFLETIQKFTDSVDATHGNHTKITAFGPVYLWYLAPLQAVSIGIGFTAHLYPWDEFLDFVGIIDRFLTKEAETEAVEEAQAIFQERR